MHGQNELRGAARWALQALARAMQDRFPGLGRRLSTAARLCDELQLQAPELVEVAVMAGALGAGQLPAVPPEAEELLALSREHWDGSGPRGLKGEEIPVQARVVALALATDEREPGRFDPFLLESMIEQRTGGSRRLLRMGRAALEAGDVGTGRQFLQGVARDPEAGWDALDALLTLARLDRRDARQLLAATLEAGRRLGPATAARAELEVGLLMVDLALPEGLALLKEAAARLDQLQLPAWAARARLALARLAPDAADDVPGWVEVLMRPGYEPDLLACAPWLIPLLLEEGVCDEALAFLIANQPHELGVQVERLSPAARARAVGHPARPRLLRIRTFGGLQVWLGDRHWGDRAWPTRLARYLFAYLAAHPGMLPLEQVREDFRIDLEPALDWLEASTGLIAREDGSVGLRADLPLWSDLEQFEKADGESLDGCRRRVELALGDFMDGCLMDWAVTRRARLQASLAHALLRLGQDSLQQGEAACALELALRLTRLDPASQPACLLAMEARLASGHPQEAARAYELCRARVGGELSTELVAAYHRARLHL